MFEYIVVAMKSNHPGCDIRLANLLEATSKILNVTF